MSSPPFCISALQFQSLRELLAEVEHGLAIGIEALTRLQPCLLRSMLLQHFQFAIDDPIDGDGGMGEGELSEGVSVSMRLRVVDGKITGPCGGRGIDAVVGNTAGKRGGDRDTAGLHVVFHVVRWGVGQKNRRLCGSDDRA